MRIGALVLAAGESARLGTPKQLLTDADGVPLVSVVVRALQRAGLDPIMVVIGANAEDVTHALIADAATVFLVPHRGWSEGMGSSIRAGIAAMSTHGMMDDVEAVMVAACDMPTADAAHFALLRTESLAAEQPPARVASLYVNSEGEAIARGIPAIFPRADWNSLLALEGDHGAKELTENENTLHVALRGGSFDLDTVADVAAWRASLTGD